jgi:hypothetical protein
MESLPTQLVTLVFIGMVLDYQSPVLSFLSHENPTIWGIVDLGPYGNSNNAYKLNFC